MLLKGSRLALRAEAVGLCVLLLGDRRLQALGAQNSLPWRMAPSLAAAASFAPAASACAMGLTPDGCAWSSASPASPPPALPAAAGHVPSSPISFTCPPDGSPPADFGTASLLLGAASTSFPADTNPAPPTASRSPSEASSPRPAATSITAHGTWP